MHAPAVRFRLRVGAATCAGGWLERKKEITRSHSTSFEVDSGAFASRSLTLVRAARSRATSTVTTAASRALVCHIIKN